MVTVQVEVLAELKVAGLHETPLSVADPGITMLPPVPLVETAVPFGAAAETFVTPILIAPEAVADKVAFTTATTPLAMAVWLRPEIKQTEEPALFEQLNVLEAAVAAAPIETLKLVKLAEL